MRLFSFRLENGSRIDVEAATAEAGYNKLSSIPVFKPVLTKYYIEVGKNSKEGKALRRLLLIKENKISNHGTNKS